MADFVRTEKTTTHVRYELPLPSNGTELSKVLNAAHRSCAELRGYVADDSLTVTAEDDLLVISFVKPEPS